MVTVSTPRPSFARDRWFFSGMAVALAAFAFYGFSGTFYLRPADFAGPPLTTLVFVHGAMMTLWVLGTVLQTSLVAVRRTALHRTLGWGMAALAAAIIISGPMVGIAAIKRGAVPPDMPPQLLLMLPMAGVTMFAGFVAAGILLRNREQAHKRLMLLSTIATLDAAAARIPGVLDGGPLLLFGLPDLFILVGIGYDLATRRSVHPTWIIGGLLIVISQPLRLALAFTPLWSSFIEAVTR